MKTLFININENVPASYPNTEVFNAGKDNILDGFYISLGMAIAEGVSVSEYKSLVIDYATAKPNEFETFAKQWDELKLALLGDNPTGQYEFQLSAEYLDWLKMNASAVYYQKYQGKHQTSVQLDIEELYGDTVDAIRRKVIRFLQENDNYKNFDEFVINDNIVRRHSVLVRAIQSQYENMAFVQYERWKNSNAFDTETNDENASTTDTNSEESKSTDSNNENSSVLIVTYKDNGRHTNDDVKEISVCRPNSLYQPIFSGMYEKHGEKEMYNGHDVLLLKYRPDGYGEKYVEISVNGLKRDLEYGETCHMKQYYYGENEDSNIRNTDELVKKIKELHSKYEDVEYIGYSREKDIHILVGLSHDCVVNETYNGADIITNAGKVLFKLSDDIEPIEIFPSGLILVEKVSSFGTSFYGVMDMKGKILIPCKYGEHSVGYSGSIAMGYYKRQRSQPKEIETGIIKIPGEGYINAFTGKMYIDVIKSYYIYTHSDDMSNVDIIDKKTNAIVCSHLSWPNIDDIFEWEGNWNGEWCFVKFSNNEHKPLLLHGSQCITFMMYEEVLEYDDIPYISEGRIVSCVDDQQINIRDFNGSIINTIRNSEIKILRPYKYGKALAINMNDSTLLYLDMNGREHIIPFNESGDLHNSFFASENTIVIKNYGEDKLINLQGEVLLDKDGSIDQLSGGYLKFYDYDKQGYGLADVQGKVLFSPHYDDFDILM